MVAVVTKVSEGVILLMKLASSSSAFLVIIISIVVSLASSLAFQGIPPREVVEGKKEQSEEASEKWKNFMESKEKKSFLVDMSNIFSFS